MFLSQGEERPYIHLGEKYSKWVGVGQQQQGDPLHSLMLAELHSVGETREQRSAWRKRATAISSFPSDLIYPIQPPKQG